MKGSKIKALVLLCFSILILLLPFLIEVQVSLVKKNQQSAFKKFSINDPRLSKITLTASQYKNLYNEQEREIKLDDILYDVKSVKQEKGGYALEVFADKEETTWQRIENKFNDLSEGQGKIKNFVSLFLYFEHPYSINQNHIYSRNEITIPGTPFLKEHYETIPTPPPDSRV